MEDRAFSPESEKHLNIPGLLTHAGRSIAHMNRHQNAGQRLKDVQSAEEFRTFLEEVDVGLADPAANWLRDQVTGEDWEKHKNALAYAVDYSYAERHSPSA